MTVYQVTVTRLITVEADTPYEAVGKAIVEPLHIDEHDVSEVQERIPTTTFLRINRDEWREARDEEDNGLGIPRSMSR